MAINFLNRGELQSILAEVDQALYNHTQWHYNLVRTLVCQLHGNDLDTRSDAHKHCLFGQWYYKQSSEKLQNHLGFINIGNAHKRMHSLVANIIIGTNTGKTVTPQEYDTFNNSMEQLRLELNSLKHEIEIALYTHDPLTGAINRADMLPTLREVHEMVKRESQVCSIAMMDLDHFKNINDKYGHPAGDKVLSEVTHYIMSELRPYDKIFRYGGEEFLICMQNTTPEACYEHINVMREGISKIPLDLGQREPVHITASFGITNLAPYLETEQCIEMADKAMYAAKEAGRNTVKIWKPSL